MLNVMFMLVTVLNPVGEPVYHVKDTVENKRECVFLAGATVMYLMDEYNNHTFTYECRNEKVHKA